MMSMSYLQIFALAAYLIAAVSGATVTFNCNTIPETCNNMCFALNRRVYNPLHFDPDTRNRRGRRQAAGCVPSPNRCSRTPHTPARVTCDEFPFASTYGLDPALRPNLGWFVATGATTRCVSTAECRSQGGSLSAFYQSFGRVDGTLINVAFTNPNNAPYCRNPGMAPDADFRTGTRPPSRRDLLDGFSTGGKPPVRRAKVYEYRTAGNLTIRSVTGPLEIGSEIFVPNDEWQNNPKVKAMLARRQGDDEGCAGTRVQMDAASLLENNELGATDKIVEQL
ncbi:hypothetical protein WG66_002589 [Moniliophthora roreri]|nr:hypothetical protein WG66_002589 [Moniliophthora roreri]